MNDLTRILTCVSLLLSLCPSPTPAYPPLSAYRLQRIAGWRVYVHRSFDDPRHKRLSHRTLRIVEVQLHACRRVLPQRALRILQKVRIWLEFTPRCQGNSGVYRRGTPTALQLHDLHPLKANAIELCGAKRLYDTAHTMPAQLLHELAHAYLLRALSPRERQQLKATYQRALQRGLYRKVIRYKAPPTRAYALANMHEYFAELSEAFFAKNDTYPLHRSQLKRYDPDGYQMIKKLWKVKHTPPPYPIEYGYRSYHFKL